MAARHIWSLSRRQFVLQAGAAAGLGLAAGQLGAEAQAAWRREPEGKRPKAAAAPDALSIDHAQLLDVFRDRTFTLDEAVFVRMLTASAIDAGRLGPRVLFGLRGCRVEGPEADAAGRAVPALTLAEAEVDHEAFRCVIGVWVRGEGFWASAASTVPHVAYLHAQQRAVQAGRMARAKTMCNQVASGVYKYKVGSHRNWSTLVQPGAFRQASEMPVVRNLDPDLLSVRRTGTWSFEGPELGDNIHAATGDAHIRYFAAGCQVMPGSYSEDRTVAAGNWRGFRIAAGLSADPPVTKQYTDGFLCAETPDDATPSCAPPFNMVVDDLAGGKGVFDYVLVSGREARMAAEDAGFGLDPAHRRLRRGSSGPEVARLQALMNRNGASGPVAETGQFDAATQRALIFGFQIPLTGGADGILARSEAYRLGFPGVIA